MDLEAAVTTVAALEDRDPAALVGPDPEDSDPGLIIPLWADGIGTGPGVTMAAVAVAWVA